MKRQPTTQQITWFLDLERNNQLDLEPPYQRRSVWSPKDRRFFLDTIFRNYPTPPIFIHRTVNEQGIATYHVVDGKQRLETILNFAKNKLSIDTNFGDEQFNGKKFNDLTQEQKRLFWDYTLVVDFLDAVDGANIEQVFDRVNRNAINLEPQELRHARFKGWFINECESEAELDFWWRIKISTKAKDKRMKNVQLIAELLAVILEQKIVGFSQDYLDYIFTQYDSPEETVPEFDPDYYASEKERVKSVLSRMEDVNGCVSTYARTANNIYPLWAVIALNQNLPDPQVLAEQYVTFMEQVKLALTEQDLTVAFPDLEEDERQNVLQYASNSKGATTEFNQRNARVSSLTAVLIS